MEERYFCKEHMTEDCHCKNKTTGNKSALSAGLDNLPDWWNELHKNGLKALSTEWQPLAELKKKLGCKAFIIMRDLCSIGKAETKDELYIHGGQECGRVYYRMVV